MELFELLGIRERVRGEGVQVRVLNLEGREAREVAKGDRRDESESAVIVDVQLEFLKSGLSAERFPDGIVLVRDVEDGATGGAGVLQGETVAQAIGRQGMRQLKKGITNNRKI